MAKIRDEVDGFGYDDEVTDFSLRDLLVQLYGHVTFKNGPNPNDVIITAKIDDSEGIIAVLVVEKLREPTLEEQIQQGLHQLGKQSKERLFQLLVKLKEEENETGK